MLLVSLGPRWLVAQTTDVVSFQGRLSAPDGTPVSDAVYDVTFHLYETDDSSTILWQEQHNVTVRDGVFSVMLGSISALPVDQLAAGLYLALLIDDQELAPRTPLSAVPYALQAHRLGDEALMAGQNVTITRHDDGALEIAATGGGTGGGLTQVSRDATLTGNGTASAPLGLADAAVTTDKLDDQAVTTDKLNDQAVTGEKLADEALVAGQNVTITRQGGGALEIAATTGGTGGLTSVASDATLAGNGTSEDPLAVSVPLVLTGSDPDGIVKVTHSSGPVAQFGHPSGAVFGYRPGGSSGYIGGVYGAYGGHTSSGNFGYLGDLDYGAYGQHLNGHFGYFGGSGYGAYGEHSNGNFGYLGQNDFGVYGRHQSSGNFGYLGSSVFGVYGRNQSAGNYGYLGYSDFGVYGRNASGNYGYFGSSDYGAYGEHGNGNYGILGQSNVGVYGRDEDTGNFGYLAGNQFAVYGKNQISGTSGYLGGNTYAGYFDGDAHVTGTLSKGGGSFKIDHPLDPANKYLAHSFVESPDMMNIYNGNVTTDAEGYATVTLPTYFEALNRDFRYQLTVIGQFVQAIVAEEIQDHRFIIQTDQPHVAVSWQVTGIRQDPWAEAHRIVVEQDKPAVERGYYLYPKLYGQPETRNVVWANDADGLRAWQEQQPVVREQQNR